MEVNKEIKTLEKQSLKSWEYLTNFCTDYTKDEEERTEFLNHLSQYLESEIELNKFEGR